MTDVMHIGRGWSGHAVEDECPCPQEPCGLVAEDRVDPACTQHTVFQSIRQGHFAAACPGAATTP